MDNAQSQLDKFRETLREIGVKSTLEKSVPDKSQSHVTINTTNDHEVTFIFDQEGSLLWITAEEIEEE
jgi:sugar/nucleoside kinase (ribokinase family)